MALHENIEGATYIIDLASSAMQIAAGLVEAVDEVDSQAAATFPDHAEMRAAIRRAHQNASLALGALRNLTDIAEEARGTLQS